jgi:hypothetical protein
MQNSIKYGNSFDLGLYAYLILEVSSKVRNYSIYCHLEPGTYAELEKPLRITEERISKQILL